MINRNDEIQQKNIDLLIEGYWYEDLPPVIDMEKIKKSVKNIIENIDNDVYEDFRKTNDIITEYKNTEAPTYIFNDGIEPITFFEFKKNGALREMQIPNLKYYCTFVYNTISVYDELFYKLYNESEYDKYVSNSNSYILFNELFHVNTLYDGNEEIIESGIFAVKNNKTTGQLAHEKNNIRYLKKQGSKLYSVKVDIESFYPNIYTHYLSKIKDVEPYKDNLDCKSYFDFLDYYNMKINNNQTKGIVTGVFSSTVSAELLMLCVDYEIKNIIGDDVTYIRYVDDMTFFSDSLEEIYAKFPLVQRVLNKYRLRINNNKTEAQKSIYNMSYVDMYEVKHRFEFFDFDSSEKVKYNKEVFYNIKGYVARIYDNNQKSEIKAFLSMFRRAIISGKLDFDEEEKIDLKTHTIAYMLQLACLEPIFASRCYRVIIEILDLINKDDRKDEIITLLKSKNEYINSTYHDSLLQIWHYYVLSKYDNKANIKWLISSFGGDEINPIILSMFVKEEKAANKEVFCYIKDTYSAHVHKKEEKDFWKKSIMFSKWWLPLLIIYLRDGKNYYKFYESQHFHEIYKKIKEDQ